jgi:aminoglycoside phosphotransferase (APT) family kinase protein
MTTPTHTQSPATFSLNQQRLLDWINLHIEGISGETSLTVKQFEGGQSNPTFLLSLGARKIVLRKKPEGNLLPSAHAIDREFKVITALDNVGFPVAKPFAYCTDTSVIGAEFYLMDFVEGRIFWDPRLPGLQASERTAIFQEMNHTIAKLHSLDPFEIGLSDYGKTGGYIGRQIARWTKQYQSSATEVIPEMDDLIEWLPKNIPSYDDTRLVHGDFRLDNMIFHPTEPKVLALLDWELSTLGHPLSDFAYHMMNWRFAPDLFRGLAGSAFEELGIPVESTYLKEYLIQTNQHLENEKDWEFYIIFNMFRMAAILQGVLFRALQGNAASEKALEAGSKAKPIAILAWQQVLALKA